MVAMPGSERRVQIFRENSRVVVWPDFRGNRSLMNLPSIAPGGLAPQNCLQSCFSLATIAIVHRYTPPNLLETPRDAAAVGEYADIMRHTL